MSGTVIHRGMVDLGRNRRVNMEVSSRGLHVTGSVIHRGVVDLKNEGSFIGTF